MEQYPKTPIIQYDKWGNLVQEWPSIAEASRALGFNYGKILACVNRHKQTYRDYIWRKQSDPLKMQPKASLF